MGKAKYPVKSLVKAIRVLDELSNGENGTSISQLVSALKIGKSTVHRLLATLRDLDLVATDPGTANYTLGPKILVWGEALQRQNLLLRHGAPMVQQLAELCKETVNLGVLEGRQVRFLARKESAEPLRCGGEAPLGRLWPSHCTALGKVLLANLSADEFAQIHCGEPQLAAMTPHSIADLARLREHLNKVREEGVAYDFEEMYEGVICLAVPVRNHTGRTVAAISITFPKQRLSGERTLRFREYLCDASARLSSQLGCSPHILASPSDTSHVGFVNPARSQQTANSTGEN